MGLFNEPENRLITALDINDEPYQRSLQNFRFRVSVYGLLVDDEMVLVTRNPYSSKYGLPGGAIEIGEKITEALIREFKEETGLDIEVNELLSVSENFFTYGDIDAQNIIIIYDVEKIGGGLLSKGNGYDTSEALYINKNKLLNGNLQSIFKDVVSGPWL